MPRKNTLPESRSLVSVAGSTLTDMPDVCPPPPDWEAITNDTGARRRPERTPLPCRARIVWEHSGEEWITTTATRYDPSTRDVYVLTTDPRNRFSGAWLHRTDIRLPELSGMSAGTATVKPVSEA